MVRLIMGALINLGKGKLTLEELENSLKVALKNRLGPTAPPQGLYLKIVNY
jgi:tRNA pseudouridine38-40 synthase